MRPRAYAEGPTVPVEKARVEIERLLTTFARMWRQSCNEFGVSLATRIHSNIDYSTRMVEKRPRRKAAPAVDSV
jgi:hypothetical protein